jgi:UTP:GlnB (protein PII) uridylyltransferase
VDIRAAKVATLGSDAIDVFYLVTKQGDKLSSEAVLNLASHICEAIQHR